MIKRPELNLSVPFFHGFPEVEKFFKKFKRRISFSKPNSSMDQRTMKNQNEEHFSKPQIK